MADGSAGDSLGQPVASGERFARLIEGDRAAILESYTESLVALHSPLVAEPRARQQVLANGSDIITDVVESVRADSVQIDESYKRLAWTIGETRAGSELSPADSLRAAMIFFNVTVGTLTPHVAEDDGLLHAFMIAMLALNESINMRIREASLSYTGYLLDRIHRAHLDERHRIARELHDRLGEGVSGALRQLELSELATPGQPVDPAQHTTLARNALTEAMVRLRLVISDLRKDPVTSLEKALTDYIAAAAPERDVRLRVSGDETWAAPTVLDEVFMIIREALRNAIAHGSPRLVLIAVQMAPHELRARVEDDGRGFDLQSYSSRDPAESAGLVTMRERAALVGGSLSLSSSPGQGTHVELVVPLPGRRDAEPG
ncbi:MAG TPA: ATP-binding protein [Streptosporangiaceae bacterium]|nr:ATP-binding protein [Streptosporangiaceae bacterium]